MARFYVCVIMLQCGFSVFGFRHFDSPALRTHAGVVASSRPVRGDLYSQFAFQYLAVDVVYSVEA